MNKNEKVKDRIHKLSFSVFAYIGKNKFNLVLEFNDNGTVTVSYMEYFNPKMIDKKELMASFANSLRLELDALHMENWKDKYEPVDCIVFDGETWNIEIEYESGNKKIVNGENAYPYNYKGLMKIKKRIIKFTEYNDCPVY